MSPLFSLLREMVSTADPQKTLFVVRSGPTEQRKGLACSVKKKSGKFLLVTCTDVANFEDAGMNDSEELIADRFCTQHPRHKNKHRIKIQDIRNDNKFSFIPLEKVPDTTFPLDETMNGNVKEPCHSYAITGNKEPERVEWSYDRTTCTWRYVTTNHAKVEKSAILGSPVLWTDNRDTRFVVGVVGSNDDALFPMFFDKSSLKVPDRPKAVTLNELPNEVFKGDITLRWKRVEDAQIYRVYQMIDNQDGRWEKVATTADRSCSIKVKNGQCYKFMVTGVNSDNLEGKESNIRRVHVSDVPMPVEITDLPIEINGNKQTLQWSKPGDNGRPIICYTVYQRILNEDGSTLTDWTCLEKDNQQLECEVSEMETGKTYEFQVTAINECGEGSKVPELIKRVKVSIDEPPDDPFSFLWWIYSWIVSFME